MVQYSLVILRMLHVSYISSRNWFDVSFDILNVTRTRIKQAKMLFCDIRSIIHNYDPFEYQKQTDFINSIESVNLMITLYIKDIICNKEYNKENSKNDFLKFLKLSLWGNRLYYFYLIF